MYQKRKLFENTLILILDLICLLISTGFAFALRFHNIYGKQLPWDQIWQLMGLSLLYIAINLIINLNHHFFQRGFFEELINVLKGQLCLAIIWILILFIIHRIDSFARLLCFYLFSINILLTYVARNFLKHYMTRVYKKSKYSNHLIIVTVKDRVEEILDNTLSYNEWKMVITGIVLLDEACIGQKIRDISIVADINTMKDFIIHGDVDEVFISLPQDFPKEVLQQWIYMMEQMGIIVDVNIETFDLCADGKKTLNRVGKYGVVTFARNILGFREQLAKRTLDIAGSMVGMLILGVVSIFVAPAIKLESPGPVFFGQTRVGKNGRKFILYKFRSMYQDAEERKKELMKQNEIAGLMFKLEDDPRITKVGKFIRKTSIDELPQFWNVLRGDMSLVGTRPPTMDEFERYEAKHKCRLSMTPGLTGMWQVSGRSDIKDFDEVIKLDMEYIDNWNLAKDIKILILTIGVVFTGHGSK